MFSRFSLFTATKSILSVADTSISYYHLTLRYISKHPAKTLITILSIFSYIEAVGVRHQIHPHLSPPLPNDMSFVQHIVSSSYDVLTNTHLNKATLAGAQYYLFGESHQNFTHRKLEVELIHKLGIAKDMIFFEGRINFFPCDTYCILANNRMHTGDDRNLCMPGIQYDNKFICKGWESPLHAAYTKKMDSLLYDWGTYEKLFSALTLPAEFYYQQKDQALRLMKQDPHQALFCLHQALKSIGKMYMLIDKEKYKETYEILKTIANQAKILLLKPAYQMNITLFEKIKDKIGNHFQEFENLYFNLSQAYLGTINEFNRTSNYTRSIIARNQDGLIPYIKASRRELKQHNFFISGHNQETT
jgi:hypothetical protein